MFNGFLTSQGAPQQCLFDPQRPSQSISNLLDWVAQRHLNTKLSTIVYVKPAVSYVKDLFKLGKARGLLQKFNATELSDKLTDTVNLEVRIKECSNACVFNALLAKHRNGINDYYQRYSLTFFRHCHCGSCSQCCAVEEINSKYVSMRWRRNEINLHQRVQIYAYRKQDFAE